MHARSAAPEFSCAPYTHSRLWGVTRTPWNLGYSCGGSSGGSGAGLAAGTTTLASGSDIGGSIRIPRPPCAAWSGTSRPTAATRISRPSISTSTAMRPDGTHRRRLRPAPEHHRPAPTGGHRHAAPEAAHPRGSSRATSRAGALRSPSTSAQYDIEPDVREAIRSPRPSSSAPPAPRRGGRPRLERMRTWSSRRQRPFRHHLRAAGRASCAEKHRKIMTAYALISPTGGRPRARRGFPEGPGDRDAI